MWEDIQMANKHEKMLSLTSIQVKVDWNYLWMLFYNRRIPKKDNIWQCQEHGEDVER